MTRLDAMPLPLPLAECAEWFAQAINYPDEQAGATIPPALNQFIEKPADVWRERSGEIYCSLFDIGKPEPPAPLQEGSYHPDPHTRLRRVVNFYRHYAVTQQPQWSPDHLSVELFFLAYLLRLAAAYPARQDLNVAIRTFVRLHPGSFAWQCAERVRQHDRSGVYILLYDALVRFLCLLGAEQRIVVADSGQPLSEDALAPTNNHAPTDNNEREI